MWDEDQENDRYGEPVRTALDKLERVHGGGRGDLEKGAFRNAGDFNGESDDWVKAIHQSGRVYYSGWDA